MNPRNNPSHPENPSNVIHAEDRFVKGKNPRVENALNAIIEDKITAKISDFPKHLRPVAELYQQAVGDAIEGNYSVFSIQATKIAEGAYVASNDSEDGGEEVKMAS